MALPKPNPGDPLRASDIRDIALATEANTLLPGKGYGVRRTAAGTTIVFRPGLALPSGESESAAPAASQQVALGTFPGDDPATSPDYLWQYAMDGTPRRICATWAMTIEGGYVEEAN